MVKNVPAQAKNEPKYIKSVQVVHNTSGSLRFQIHQLVATNAEVLVLLSI